MRMSHKDFFDHCRTIGIAILIVCALAVVKYLLVTFF